MLSFRIKHSCFSFKELTSCVETPLKDLTNTSWHRASNTSQKQHATSVLFYLTVTSLLN
jgi:hypothetical protein